MSKVTKKITDKHDEIPLDDIQRWDIPDTWTWKTVNLIGEIVTGNTPSTKDNTNYGNDIPFVKPPSLQDKVIRDAPEGLSKKGMQSARILPSGAVLVSCIGNLGKTGIVNISVAFNQQINAIIFSEVVIPKFGFYYTQTLKNWLYSVSSATTLPIVNKGKFQKAPIPVAPLNEQKRIVEEIEKQFSRLDEAVENLKRVKANLKRYKASVLKAAVEGKLTEEWREKHPDVEPADKLLERILAERRKKWEEAELAKMKAKGKKPKDDKWKKKYKEPKLQTIEDVPEFPASWIFVGIEQLLPEKKDAMKTGPFGSLLKKHEHRQKGIQVLGIENIQAMKFVFGSKIHIDSNKAKELVGYCAVPGDILISRSGTVGEVCVVPDNIGEARISTNLMKLSLEKNGMLPQLFTFLFNGSPFILNQVSELCKGSTRNFLNQDILKRIVFILPPLKEQKKIIQEVENKISLIDGIEKEVDRNFIRAARLRQSILKKAFSGKLLKTICGKGL